MLTLEEWEDNKRQHSERTRCLVCGMPIVGRAGRFETCPTCSQWAYDTARKAAHSRRRTLTREHRARVAALEAGR